MTAIEPGEKFFVGYGNGKSVEVVALGMREKRKALKHIKDVEVGSDPEFVFEAIEDILRVCIPDMPDDFLDTVDEGMAMDICRATLAKQGLSEDERKKSESPHS